MKNISDMILNKAQKIKQSVKNVIGAVSCDIEAAKHSSNLTSLGVILFDDGFHAVLSHRIAKRIDEKGYSRIANAISFATKKVTGIEISPRAKIERGVAVSVSPAVKIQGSASIANGTVIMTSGAVLSGDVSENTELCSPEITNMQIKIENLESRLSELEKKKKR